MDIAHKAAREQIKAAAQKFGGNQEWGYYREYYRGENTPAHDDDYEGSGTLTFAEVADSLCKTVEQVEKLSKVPVGQQISDISGHYRIYYTRKK